MACRSSLLKSASPNADRNFRRSIPPGASPIVEYIDEIDGAAMGARRLVPTDPHARVEVRRLVERFTIKLDAAATNWLVQEKILKRYAPQGGAPEMDPVRARPTCVITCVISMLSLDCADYLDDAPGTNTRRRRNGIGASNRARRSGRCSPTGFQAWRRRRIMRKSIFDYSQGACVIERTKGVLARRRQIVSELCITYFRRITIKFE